MQFFDLTYFAHYLESGILLHWKAEKISYRWYKIPKVLKFVSVRTEFYPTNTSQGSIPCLLWDGGNLKKRIIITNKLIQLLVSPIFLSFSFFKSIENYYQSSKIRMYTIIIYHPVLSSIFIDNIIVLNKPNYKATL